MSAIPGPPSVPSPPPAAPTEARPDRSGRVALGLLLVALGIVWLLSALHVTSAWRVALPALLVVTGVALLARPRSRSGGGLVVLGIVLTIVLAASASVNIPVGGSVGDRVVAPPTVGGLAREYRLSAGTLTLDLSALHLPPGTTSVTASVGMGTLVVEVPPGAAVRVDARSGAGTVTVFGRQESGVGIGFVARRDLAGAPRLELVLSVGLGTVEVR